MQSHSFFSLLSKSLKRLPALLALALMPFLAGCATTNSNYFTIKYPGTSRTYNAWKNHPIGTAKEFEGALTMGGKTFPARLVQRLQAVTPSMVTLESSFFIAGLPGGSEEAYVPATGFGTLGLDDQLMRLTAGVPATTGGNKVISSGKPAPGMVVIFQVTPNQRTFQIKGKSVSADLYLLSKVFTHNGATETTKAWFSPEIPGGWIAVDHQGGAAGDNPAVSTQLAAQGTLNSKTIFFLARKSHLTLK